MWWLLVASLTRRKVCRTRCRRQACSVTGKKITFIVFRKPFDHCSSFRLLCEVGHSRRAHYKNILIPFKMGKKQNKEHGLLAFLFLLSFTELQLGVILKMIYF
jgi:hypothetical protein